MLLPSVMALREPLFETSEPAVTLKFAVLNVPSVMFRFLVPVFNASPSVSVIPEPLTVTPLNVLPAVVSIPVPVNVTVPVCVKVMPETSVTLPATVILEVPEIVPVKPVQLIDFAPVLPEVIVQVPLDVASKNTSSAVVGTDAPVGPPAVAAHLEPAVPSQFAVPPRQ